MSPYRSFPVATAFRLGRDNYVLGRRSTVSMFLRYSFVPESCVFLVELRSRIFLLSPEPTTQFPENEEACPSDCFFSLRVLLLSSEFSLLMESFEPCSLNSVMTNDLTYSKMFIGGLNWETTDRTCRISTHRKGALIANYYFATYRITPRLLLPVR